MLPSSSMYSSSIKLPWEEWFLCLERKLDRDADMQSLPTCGLAKVQTMAKLWGDRETKLWYAFWKEVVINEQWWRIEEPPELFSRSESKMPTTGSWSVRHHHIFTSSSAFLKSFQPCLYTFIVKQGQVIRKCMHRKKWRPAKKGIGRPITRCHCDFCDLWKRAQHGKHRFPILKGQKQTD